jgi:hypothetical protein
MATNLRAMTINMMRNWNNLVHPKPPRRYNSIDDRCWDGGFKVEIPELNNDMNGIGFIDCSSTGERVFDGELNHPTIVAFLSLSVRD